MPDLPKKKVGIVACSGEERAEGTVTRLAALKVLELLRPDDTVTICLPLFLAGGQGDRAFARFYPTVAVDGCDTRCAARATEQYSAAPAASLVVTDLTGEHADLGSARRLNEAGQRAVRVLAQQLAEQVDDLLGKPRDQSSLRAAPEVRLDHRAETPAEPAPAVEASCSCGSGIPVLTLSVGDQRPTLIAVPAIFEQLYQQGKRPGVDGVGAELLQLTRICNAIPDAEAAAYQAALAREFETFCCNKEG
jgi:uncharacterized metal-binding protein